MNTQPLRDEHRELRRILYGLYALVKLHFAKEEEIYLPLLDRRLSSEEGRDLFEAMEKEAARAHAEVHNNE
jgi:iron-sulfur cluster repair protein YtfE (RIC family)